MTCTNTGVTVSYGFDVMDRVTNIVWQNSASNVLASFAYQYNNASMITNVNLSGFRSQVSVYNYDDLDRLTSEKSTIGNQQSEISYSYDEVGNRLTKTNGAVSVAYSYSNGCNRLTGWTATSTNDFATLRQADVAGVSSEVIGTNSYLGQLYVSNSVGKVTPAVSGSNFTAAAFPLAYGTNQVVAAMGDAAGNVGYVTNTVTLYVVTNAAYGFNAAGCVTNIGYGGSGFSRNIGLNWNSQYQLTSVSTNGVECERNGFDALGRRVWNWNGTTTNFFVYDGSQIIADVDSTGGLRRSYVWGPGIDNLLAETVYTGATVKTYYAITDHLRSVHAMVDETGVIVESYRMDAFGKTTVYDGNGARLVQSAIGNRYVWQGREMSRGTGLYYFRARWYDPITGRWLSNDPIGINGGLNQYVFCDNNPVNFTDPSGLRSDLNLHVPGSEFFNDAEGVKNEVDRDMNRVYIVAGHGVRDPNDPDHVAHSVRDSRIITKIKDLTPEELADIIINDKAYKSGQTVYLETCNTGRGKGGDNAKSYAQKLADALTKKSKRTTTVWAPTGTASYYGQHFVLNPTAVRSTFVGTR